MKIYKIQEEKLYIFHIEKRTDFSTETKYYKIVNYILTRGTGIIYNIDTLQQK